MSLPANVTKRLVYEPLNPPGQSIRVVTLYPGAFLEPIRISLGEIQLGVRDFPAVQVTDLLIHSSPTVLSCVLDYFNTRPFHMSGAHQRTPKMQ
jgi:hypothetical protein